MEKIKSKPITSTLSISETLERLKRNGVLKPFAATISQSTSILETSQIKLERIGKINSNFNTLKTIIKTESDDIAIANDDTDEACLRCRNCGIKLEDNYKDTITSIEKLICSICDKKKIDSENEEVEYLDDDVDDNIEEDKKDFRVDVDEASSDMSNKNLVLYFCTDCRQNYSSLEYLKDHAYHLHFVCQRQRKAKRPRKKKLITPYYNILKHDQNYVLLLTPPVHIENQHSKLPTRDEITDLLVKCRNSNFRRFNCPMCPDFFSTDDEIQTHLLNTEHTRNDGSFLCHQCNNLFTSLTLLKKHVARKHNIGKYDVDENDQLSFNEFDELFHSDDEKDAEGEDLYSSIVNEPTKKLIGKSCYANNGEEEWLLDEVESDDNDKTCSYCSENFSTTLLKDVHEQFKHKLMSKIDTVFEMNEIDNEPTTSYYCQLCRQYYESKKKLSHHLLSKHHKSIKNNEYQCRLCTEIFRLSTMRTKHERKVHANPSTYQYECQKSNCNKSYQRPELLKGHLTSHDGIKTYTCDRCDRSFVLEKYLKQHRMLHFQNEKHVCDKCQRVFKSAYNLTKHMNVHNPESRKKCDQCEKTFADPRDLQRHQFSHGNFEKQFKCDLCSFQAYIKTDLSRHFRTIHRQFQPEHKTRAPII